VRQLEEQLGRDGLVELVTRFLDRMPYRLTELREAVHAGDASGTRESARSLKATARSFGAAEVSEIAAQVEHNSAAGSLQRAEELVNGLDASFDRTRVELRQQLPLSRVGG
jgi:HPt (histidine-containing phosphotransfer) domain-containing protein